MIAKTRATEEYFIENEPFYQAVGEEIAIFEAACLYPALRSTETPGRSLRYLRVFRYDLQTR
ncbi:hypothetical protein MNBD_GAMMA24-1126 [hydrothermal vent metagenome]|uniref:Uncharacterized protein n=1 Tax=hydrothermal vent metagenome TaxID=652676 RepID=A0A3B1C3M3_9ZZZZ